MCTVLLGFASCKGCGGEDAYRSIREERETTAFYGVSPTPPALHTHLTPPMQQRHHRHALSRLCSVSPMLCLAYALSRLCSVSPLLCLAYALSRLCSASPPPTFSPALHCSNGITAMGVADGVYMWREQGIDAGLFRCARGAGQPCWWGRQGAPPGMRCRAAARPLLAGFAAPRPRPSLRPLPRLVSWAQQAADEVCAPPASSFAPLQHHRSSLP